MSTNSAVLTVSQVNQTIKQMLEEMPTFRSLYVQGEISNYKAHSSGHRYFTLKDEQAALSAVMFRSGCIPPAVSSAERHESHRPRTDQFLSAKPDRFRCMSPI